MVSFGQTPVLPREISTPAHQSHMPTCAPAHNSDYLPYGPACGVDCAGVTFAVNHVNSHMEGGDCVFSWKATRTIVGDNGTQTQEFSGVETVGCAGRKDIILYCDNGQSCPRYRLRFECVEQDAGGNG